MATYTGKQSVLDNILGEYSDYGFRLEDEGDQFTLLYFKDKLIARFNQVKVTPDIILAGCRNYLKNIMRDI